MSTTSKTETIIDLDINGTGYTVDVVSQYTIYEGAEDLQRTRLSYGNATLLIRVDVTRPEREGAPLVYSNLSTDLVLPHRITSRDAEDMAVVLLAAQHVLATYEKQCGGKQ